jgi:hypothetical protein
MTRARDLASGVVPGTWIAYTPTLGGVTVGNGTNSFFYAQIGKTVFVKGKFTLGSTSSITSSISISLPISARTNISVYQTIGMCSAFNSSAIYEGQIFYSTNTLNLQASVVNGTYAYGTPMNGSAPFSWSNGHSFTVECTYEAA